MVCIVLAVFFVGATVSFVLWKVERIVVALSNGGGHSLAARANGRGRPRRGRD